jgi:hypothetical protein
LQFAKAMEMRDANDRTPGQLELCGQAKPAGSPSSSDDMSTNAELMVSIIDQEKWKLADLGLVS